MPAAGRLPSLASRKTRTQCVAGDRGTSSLEALRIRGGLLRQNPCSSGRAAVCSLESRLPPEPGTR